MYVDVYGHVYVYGLTTGDGDVDVYVDVDGNCNGQRNGAAGSGRDMKTGAYAPVFLSASCVIAVTFFDPVRPRQRQRQRQRPRKRPFESQRRANPEAASR